MFSLQASLLWLLEYSLSLDVGKTEVAWRCYTALKRLREEATVDGCFNKTGDFDAQSLYQQSAVVSFNHDRNLFLTQ